jgi:hypothetical protein
MPDSRIPLGHSQFRNYVHQLSFSMIHEKSPVDWADLLDGNVLSMERTSSAASACNISVEPVPDRLLTGAS